MHGQKNIKLSHVCVTCLLSLTLLTILDKDKQREASLNLINISGLFFSLVYGLFKDAGLKTSSGELVVTSSGELVVNDAFESM